MIRYSLTNGSGEEALREAKRDLEFVFDAGIPEDREVVTSIQRAIASGNQLDLFQTIPELDPTKGGTLIGSSRDYIDPSQGEALDLVTSRLKKLGIEYLLLNGGGPSRDNLRRFARELMPAFADAPKELAATA